MAGNGRFGSRYGSKVRKNVMAVEKLYKYKNQVCPYCGEEAVKRESAGVFACKKCGKKFAGGAYIPETLTKTNIINKLFDKRGNATARAKKKKKD